MHLAAAVATIAAATAFPSSTAHAASDAEAGASVFRGYSEALLDAGVVWSDETMDCWVANPRQFVPGTRISFPGLRDEQDRADVIAHLRQNTE